MMENLQPVAKRPDRALIVVPDNPRIFEFADRIASDGERILDVGCGTGTLAITAKRQVGQSGTVHGVDASREMLARAEKKARKAAVDVLFRNGLAEALPFEDSFFDVALRTHGNSSSSAPKNAATMRC